MGEVQKVRAVDIKSRTEKTYTVTLEGCDPRDWPYSRSGRTYQPTVLVVLKRDGSVASVTLRGPQVKKDGTHGSQWADERLYGNTRPGWLDSIVGGLA